MNGELGNFFITFTTNGLDQLKTGMKEISEKMDNLNATMSNSKTGGDKFFGGMGGWLGKITALTGGILTLGKAIKDTFAIGDKIINLNLLADAAGASAEKVEALAIATQPFGGNVQSAANFYRTMKNLQTEMGRGQYGESMREELSRAGFFVNPNASEEEYMRALSNALTSYTQAGKFGDRDKLAKAFGLDDPMMLFLSGGQENVEKMLAYGRQHSRLSGEENLKAAQELRKASNELKEIWDKILIQMMPILTQILEALKPILEALRPIAEWALKQVGGVLNVFGNAIDVITGKKTLEEAAKDIEEKNPDGIIGWAVNIGKKMGEGWGDLNTYVRRNTEIKDLMSKFDAGNINYGEAVRLRSLLTEYDSYDEKTKSMLEPAIKNLAIAARSKLNARTVNNSANTNNSVNIETINITGMGESAGRQTVDSIQRNLDKVQFQPATLSGGYK